MTCSECTTPVRGINDLYIPAHGFAELKSALVPEPLCRMKGHPTRSHPHQASENERRRTRDVVAYAVPALLRGG